MTLKVILMVNWGMGLEILKATQNLPEVKIHKVITVFEDESKDKWRNAVYDYCLKNHIPVIKEKDIDFKELKHMIAQNKIDLMLLHGFMKKVPPEVYLAPRLKSINIHPSLLPKYRGPSPNYWVLRNKEKNTGVTSYFINERFDAGSIISQAKVKVLPEDDLDSLIDKQKLLIKGLLQDTFVALLDKTFKPKKQTEWLTTYAPRPKNGECRL